MVDEQDAREVAGTTAHGSDGERIGTVGRLHLDDRTGRPEFVSVGTGLLGRRESWVPVAEATREGDRLTLPFDGATVTGAPDVGREDGYLDEQAVQRLYEYYGSSWTGAGGGPGGGGQTSVPAGSGADSGATERATDTDSAAAGDVHWSQTDDDLATAGAAGEPTSSPTAEPPRAVTAEAAPSAEPDDDRG